MSCDYTFSAELHLDDKQKEALKKLATTTEYQIAIENPDGSYTPVAKIVKEEGVPQDMFEELVQRIMGKR